MDRPAPYHFRRTGRGTEVYRVTVEEYQNRLSLERIARIDAAGEIAPTGDKALRVEERAEIAAAYAVSTALPESPATRALDALGRATDWADRRASPEDLAAVEDALLLALHDLRRTLARARTRD